MESKRVGVIFGSRSVEHDVSIVTAHQIMEELAKRHDVMPIYITREGRWLAGPGLYDLEVYKNKTWDKVGEPAFISPQPGRGLTIVDVARAKKRKGGPFQVRVVAAVWLQNARPEQVDLDVIVPAVHGTFGEDGSLQGLLELADIPYTGSGVAASAVGMDKLMMRDIFKANDLPVVDALIVEGLEISYELAGGKGNGSDADPDRLAAAHQTFETNVDEVDEQIRSRLNYPVFVKPVTAGSSVGINKAIDRDSLRLALEVAANYDSRVLIERSMEGCIEVNCSVLGGPGTAPRVSLCEQPISWTEFLSFEDKYMRGGKSTTTGAKDAGMASADRRIPAPIPDELTKQVQENALQAFRAIGAAGVARIDSFVNQETGETWVMEINTMPGSFSFYLWRESGLSFADLADQLIEIALETHRRKSRLMYTFESGMLEGMKGPKTS
jgi:D-alanine-D-alanine ligase